MRTRLITKSAIAAEASRHSFRRQTKRPSLCPTLEGSILEPSSISSISIVENVETLEEILLQGHIVARGCGRGLNRGRGRNSSSSAQPRRGFTAPVLK